MSGNNTRSREGRAAYIQGRAAGELAGARAALEELAEFMPEVKNTDLWRETMGQTTDKEQN